MLEHHLRHWLRTAYSGVNLNFIEPAHGSTIGLPDVEIPIIGGERLSVELKIGFISNTGRLHVKLRPSQYRYHILESERGNVTGILVAVGSKEKFDVYAFAGRHCENDAYKESRNLHFVIEDQRWTDKCSRERLDTVFKAIMERAHHELLSRVL